MNGERKRLIINVVGQTAIGKTALAITLAQHFKTEIISSDSRQFFKEMTIGTAVPSAEELKQATHHFIQHKSIFEPYSVGDFAKEADVLISQLFENQSIIILVGGSGLYADTLLNGIDDFPEIPNEIRMQLNEEYAKNGIEFLQNELKKSDFLQYSQMDIKNPQRLIRALEVCRASGKPYSSFLQKKEKKQKYSVIEIGLTADRSIVYNRINNRVEKMLESGLLLEAQQLFPHRNLNALQTVGYRELFDFFNKKIGFLTAVEEIKKNTRNFAKRQATWYAKNKNIQWFDYQADTKKIIDFITNKIS